MLEPALEDAERPAETPPRALRRAGHVQKIYGVIAEEGDPQTVLGSPKTPGLQAFVDAIRF